MPGMKIGANAAPRPVGTPHYPATSDERRWIANTAAALGINAFAHEVGQPSTNNAAYYFFRTDTTDVTALRFAARNTNPNGNDFTARVWLVTEMRSADGSPDAPVEWSGHCVATLALVCGDSLIAAASEMIVQPPAGKLAKWVDGITVSASFTSVAPAVEFAGNDQVAEVRFDRMGGVGVIVNLTSNGASTAPELMAAFHRQF